MKIPEVEEASKQDENKTQIDRLSARMALQEIRGDIYQYLCTPYIREATKSGFYKQFILLRSLTSACILSSQEPASNRLSQNYCRLLTEFEDLVYEALDGIDNGKEQNIINSLNDGPIHQRHQEIDAYLSTVTDPSRTNESSGEDDILQIQVNALFTVIELIGAIAVLFPGVFVSIGVPATFAKSISMLSQVQKVYPGVQMVLDRKQEIMILVGTMAAFAGGMHKNATQILQQMATDENINNITVVDETGKTIQASELIQYALELESGKDRQIGLGSGSEPSEIRKDESPGPEPEEDLIRKFTRLMSTITNPVGDTIKTADQIAHHNIQARLEDVSRGKELLIQVPLTITDVGVRVGTDISTKIREISGKVDSIAGKDKRGDDKL